MQQQAKRNTIATEIRKKWNSDSDPDHNHHYTPFGYQQREYNNKRQNEREFNNYFKNLKEFIELKTKRI